MRPSARRDEPANVRETLHELTNALAAARMWLLVVDGAEQPHDAALAEPLLRLNRSISNAEECCHRLRACLPRVAPRKDK